MDTRTRIERVIARVGDLPAISAVVAEVMQLVENPNSEMEEIAAAIQKDPALTAKILRISNSPYYGMRQYVGNLKLALVILGVREVRNIVLGIAVMESINDFAVDVRVASEIWTHSFLVAGIAKRLGERLQLRLQSEAFICGLLHDIGILVLARSLGEEYRTLYRQHVEDVESLSVAEEKKFGFSHADTTAALAEKWNFPGALTDALRMHHMDSRAALSNARDPQLAAVVRIANHAANQDLDHCAPEEIIAIQDLDAWEQLADAPQPLHPDEWLAALSEMKDELEDVAPPAF